MEIEADIENGMVALLPVGLPDAAAVANLMVTEITALRARVAALEARA